MTGGLLDKMERKGNGFAIGEVTGPGVARWHVFLHVRLGGRR